MCCLALMTDDPWAELDPIYRTRPRNGKLGRMMRLNRQRRPMPGRVLAVIDRDGVLLPENSYSLRKPIDYPKIGWTGCLYFDKPVMTAGMTVLWESRPPGRAGRPRKSTHGTNAMYRKHCRCDLCRDAHATWQRGYRRRLAPGDRPHGERRTYYANCRCDPCKAAMSAYNRRSRILRELRHG